MNEEHSDLASHGVAVAREEADEIRSALTDPTENRLKQWILLTGNRSVVTAMLLGAVFALLIGVSFVRPYDMRTLLTETNAIQMLFSGLLSGAILLVSIVVSINSVVLSQEITDIEHQQERIAATIDYRNQIEQLVESGVTPTRPAEFLPVILYAILEQTRSLERIAADSDDDEFREQVDAFSERVSADVEQARDALRTVEFGEFEVLLAGLNYGYSGQLHAARALDQQYGDAVTDDDRDVLDRLIETFTLFGTARGYFQSLYYKQELARLSGRLLYVSLPVIVFTSYVLLALDAKFFPEATVLGLSPLLLFVSLAYAIALAPYVVLTAHVIRATSITLRTLAAGPFILQRRNAIEDFDVPTAADTLDWAALEPTDDG